MDCPWASISWDFERSDPHKARQEAPVLLLVLRWPDFLSFVNTCSFWLVSIKFILEAQKFHQDTPCECVFSLHPLGTRESFISKSSALVFFYRLLSLPGTIIIRLLSLHLMDPLCLVSVHFSSYLVLLCSELLGRFLPAPANTSLVFRSNHPL